MDKISELSKPLKKHKWPELDCRNRSLGPKEKSLKRKKKGMEHAKRERNRILGGKMLDEKDSICFILTLDWIFKITGFVKYAKKNDKNKNYKRDLDKR